MDASLKRDKTLVDSVFSTTDAQLTMFTLQGGSPLYWQKRQGTQEIESG
jgi:hypothetical protein